VNQIRKVERAARKHAESREALEAAIRLSASEGASLRQLAKASGWSHEQVRRVLAR